MPPEGDRDAFPPARSLSFVTPLAVHPNSYAEGNSLSSLPNSTSTRSNSAKHLTSPPPKDDLSPRKKNRKLKTGGADDKKEEDKEPDHLGRVLHGRTIPFLSNVARLFISGHFLPVILIKLLISLSPRVPPLHSADPRLRSITSLML